MALFCTTQELVDLASFDKSRIVFDRAQVGQIPGSTLSFKRVALGYRTADGAVSELLMATPAVFSFGVCENRLTSDDGNSSFSLPLCLWSRTGPTPEERLFTDTFEKIVEATKDHVMDIKDDIGKGLFTQSMSSTAM